MYLKKYKPKTFVVNWVQYKLIPTIKNSSNQLE